MNIQVRNVMTRIASTPLLMLSMAVGGTIATARAAENAFPELIVDIDVNDEVWLRPHKMTEAGVSDLVAKLKENGLVYRNATNLLSKMWNSSIPTRPTCKRNTQSLLLRGM